VRTRREKGSLIVKSTLVFLASKRPRKWTFFLQRKSVASPRAENINDLRVSFVFIHCVPEGAFSAPGAEHVHDYDEYMLVVQGCYTLLVNGKRIRLNASEKYFIARGVAHAGEVLAGTRTIHAFEGHRANRELRDSK
jgi:hypothetical protein